MEAYAASRADLIARVTRVLEADPRFVAAWLEGSFGRGEGDAVSDLDLAVVVDDPFGEELCARPWTTAGRTSAERLALVRQFGEPAVIHENNNNARPGGTFTFVLYRDWALMVDWILIPRGAGSRPARSRLLFDRVGIPVQEPVAPESGAERRHAISEQLAFFWMMAAVTAKYVIRRDTIAVLQLLEIAHRAVLAVEALAAGESPPPYRLRSLGSVVLTTDEQAAAIRALAARVERLAPGLAAEGVEVPDSPMPVLDRLLGLAGG